jgi:alanyl-tRNA synthetase
LGDEKVCGDTPCAEYSFIGNPLIKKKLNVDSMRSLFISFFEKRGHKKIERYPVVARWRNDVFLVNASIYDFQPHVTSGLVEPPANPLVISQPCIRMTDLDFVGKTGKHLSSFEMMAHHAFNTKDKMIYWKDKTTRYCHELLTKELGIEENNIIYKECPWVGGGNAGPSLEVIVGGIELATLVFMNMKRDEHGEVELEGEKFAPLDINVVDTGYGLERFVWCSLGTPTIYDAIYPKLVGELFDIANISYKIDDENYSKILAEHAKLAGLMEINTASQLISLREEVVKRLKKKGISLSVKEFEEMMIPIEHVYAISDHARSLAFMLSDGIVPSNVKSGYLTRLIIRRTIRLLEEMNLDISLSELVVKQMHNFKDLVDWNMKNVICEILDLETKRYGETVNKGLGLVKRHIKKGEVVSSNELLNFYDSHGIHPTLVQKIGAQASIKIDIPDNFHAMLAQRHMRAEEEEIEEEMKFDLPATKLLFYEEPDLKEFKARVLYSKNDMIVLDRTAFYAEGGGQPSDQGVMIINGKSFEVKNVEKIGNNVVHKVKGAANGIKVGDEVNCKIDWERRLALTRHHTATHILVGAAREILGKHIWQAGAQKGVKRSRIDISHYKKIEGDELREIELLANKIVLENLLVKKFFLDRNEAEKRYGFGLYQGGAPIGKKIRIVEIEEFDAQGCGGTHCSSTNEVGLIKIVRTERIQDGVERIEFSAGLAAVEHIQKQDRILQESSDVLSVLPRQLPKTVKRFFDEWKNRGKEIEELRSHKATTTIEDLLSKAVANGNVINDVKVITHVVADDKKGVEEIMGLAREIGKKEKVVGILGCKYKGAKLVVVRGKDVWIDCSKIAQNITKIIGGSSGGKQDFAQGGGPDEDKLEEAINEGKKEVIEILKN